jgi:hypothetical protein
MQSRQSRSCSAVSLFFTRSLLPLNPGEERGRGIEDPSGKLRSPGRTLAKTSPPSFLFAVEGESRIERQLHVVGAGQLPRVGRDVAGFVVDHQQGAVVQAVNAVQAQVERESGKVNGALGLGLGDLEFNARGFVLQPLGDQLVSRSSSSSR